MTLTRKFLDWSRPALPEAARYLASRYGRDRLLDLSQVIVVLPGRRAGRRLAELLVDLSQRQSLTLLPPEITTVGALPELLYESKRPLASDLLQQLVWVYALRDARQQASQFIARLPSDDDVRGWRQLGVLLWRQHRELAGEGFDFSDVIRAAADLGGFPDHDRWRFLRRLQTAYLELLDRLEFWDVQTARLHAIQHRECSTDRDVVLVATADMNRATRAMLDQISDRVTALVSAPAAIADRFDAHGCIQTAAWQDVAVALDTDQVWVVDGPADQAAAVARAIESYEGQFRADQIAVGLPDDRLVPQLERQLMQHGVATRWVAGTRMSQSAPYRLLEAVAAYLERHRLADMAALLRHPDLEAWIHSSGIRGDWLTQLDEYYNDHLQPRLGAWLGAEDKSQLIRRVHTAVDELLKPLAGQPRRLGQWAEPIAQLLQIVYDQRRLDPEAAGDHLLLGAFQRTAQVLLDHQSLPRKVTPSLTGGEAIELTLNQLQSELIPPRSDEDAVELLGWLELPLDTSPALVVTSLNEGFVPTSVNSDLFLPNSLRRKLGLIDNDRRYARDVYALSSLVASRDRLQLVVGRRDAEGNPLVPSRLLLAGDPKTVAQRALAFFQPVESPPAPALLFGASAAPRQSAFAIPPPEPLDKPLDSVSVTALRSYLACPYRFYLRHVRRLQPLADTAAELDAPAFGNLVHQILHRFGTNPVSESTDAGEIRQFLERCLQETVTHAYGTDRLPAVDVQLLQLRARLDAFATWQAGWARAGWQIRYCETSGQEKADGQSPQAAGLETADGRWLGLRGRIDRIDFHAASGRWAVFDYKTSDSAKRPEHAHRRAGRWIDLQLPLYRHLLLPIGITERVQLGYVVLPKETAKVGALLADWSSRDLADADQTAREVAAKILDQQFWPPTYPPPSIDAEFASICQVGVFQSSRQPAVSGS